MEYDAYIVDDPIKEYAVYIMDEPVKEGEAIVRSLRHWLDREAPEPIITDSLEDARALITEDLHGVIVATWPDGECEIIDYK